MGLFPVGVIESNTAYIFFHLPLVCVVGMVLCIFLLRIEWNAGSYVCICVTWVNTAGRFFRVVEPVCIPTSSGKSLNCFVSLPTLGIVSVSHFSRCCDSAVIAHCGINIHFPDNWVTIYLCWILALWLVDDSYNHLLEYVETYRNTWEHEQEGYKVKGWEAFFSHGFGFLHTFRCVFF